MGSCWGPLAILAFPLLVNVIYHLNYLFDYTFHYIEEDLTAITFDFIIVGGGSSGCVLASRLSENSKFKVLLIEAGGTPTWLANVPLVAPYLQKSLYDWRFVTVPQRNACLSLHEQRSSWPRGKGLGGTSQFNYMMYVRGHQKDYDHWANLGNWGWGYKDVLKYFKRSEDFKSQSIQWSDYHGTDGYAAVDDLNWTPLLQDFFDAGLLLGYNVSNDCNGPTQGEFCKVHVNQHKSARCNTYDCFLSPVLNRPNLYILKRALAHKILINDQKKAYGVLVETYGNLMTLRCSREVILSAGSIGSPQLLMLSGIGPADHLESLKIAVLSNLSVGKNLQDHYGTFLLPFIINETVSVHVERDLQLIDIWNYFINNKGVMTSVMGTQGMAILKSPVASNDDQGDVQLFFLSMGIAHSLEDSLTLLGGVKKEVIDSYIRPFLGSDAIEFLPLVTRPRSRGELLLMSNKPGDPPLIDPKYFSSEDDLKAVVFAIRSCLNITKTKPFQRYEATLPPVHLPGCEYYELWSDEYWKCYVQHLTFSIYHPAGTCKMGPPDDQSAVVNHELRVYGVDGLRIVDASIMPTIVNGNTHATVVMIAEKAADMILSHWEDRSIHQDHSNMKYSKDEL